ncbi:ROK family transcriptional regulator [Devosia sp.]|uniref:ROK family transcriptional regulator n=1 Tax=Devosia sp. TaxID=1871048 RepID=UPI003262DA32
MSRAETHDIFEAGAKRMAASGLRQNNERAVLIAVATQPGSSSAEIARRTGLGAQSISRILGDLEVEGMVMRGEARRGYRGQPAIPIYLDPGGAYCIGCEIGWQHLEIVARNLSGEILGQQRRDYAFPDATTIVAEVTALARQMTDLIAPGHRSRLIGLGLALPGGTARHINRFGGTEADAAAWKNLDITNQLAASTGLQIFAFNDGNAACWAELAASPAPRPNNLAYFLVGSFIAAGIVAEGRLWEGPSGNSANLGSILVTDRHGKQNFVHLIASIHALESLLRAAGKPVPVGSPAQWDWPTLEPEASLWLDEGAKALAKAIVNTAAVMEFNIAIVDGAMPRPIVQRLVDLVRHHSQDLPVLTTDRPKVEMGRLGAAAAARGAASIPLYRRFFSREREDILAATVR